MDKADKRMTIIGNLNKKILGDMDELHKTTKTIIKKSIDDAIKAVKEETKDNESTKESKTETKTRYFLCPVAPAPSSEGCTKCSDPDHHSDQPTSTKITLNPGAASIESSYVYEPWS